MIRHMLALTTFLWLVTATLLSAQEPTSAPPRHLRLDEAVQLALQHNHIVRIARSQVEEKQHSKEIAHSAYYPLLRNDSSVLRLTDTEFIAIPKGSLGVAGGALIPPETAVLNQGGLTVVTSGTGLTQPLTGLLRVKSANDVAAAELRGTRSKAQATQNQIALQVREIYYRILVLQSHKDAAQAKLRATEDLQKERLEQVKYGSALQESSIESRAEFLQSKQDVLTTDLQLSDTMLQLDDAIGLPLTTQLVLDPSVPTASQNCQREECISIALAKQPEIAEAQAKVDQAMAAVRLAKRQFIPDLEAFARYSYSDNVPFLARNFGSFGAHFGYDLFDGGRRNAEIAERKAQLDQANENLARVKEDVELRVQIAYNKLERTREMRKVSEELLATRTEAHRVSAQQLQQGAALPSEADAAAARESEAKAILLQSQLDYLQASDEMTEAMGLTPE